MNKLEQSELDSALFKKLQDLTMKIPGDPTLYKQEIAKYSLLYKQQFTKLLGDIQRKNQRFAELLIFLSRSIKHYTSQLDYIPGQVIDLLKNHGPNLHPYVRKKCVGSIMILRAKNVLYPVETIQFLLTLFNIEDKQLRKILYKYIVNDIRRMNKHHKNVKINQQIRDYIYQMVLKNSDKMTQKSIQLMIDLYKRNIWTDNRCVNIIAEGCFNQSAKIRMISSYFLIATTQPLEQLQDSDQDLPNPSEIKFKKGIRKHTKNKQKQVQKQKKRAQRRLRKKQVQGRRVNFMPIDVIYSPQDFAQKLFLQISRKSTKFVHKIVYFGLISRLIWHHKLILLPFYSHLSKYLEPKQKQVAKILTYMAESIHENIPDEEIEEIIKIITQKFVNDKCSQYAMTVGLNTIRQIYSKLPGIITEEAMLYLGSYHEYKNKNVSRAAKALINLVRQINPYLLQKKYRGRSFSGTQATPIGVAKQKVKSTIQGADLLNYQSDIPIYMDKILTDQDFKMIRKLRRKQQQQQQMAQLQQSQEDFDSGLLASNQDQLEIVDQDEDIQDEEDEDDEDEDDSDDQEQIDWNDCQQLQQLVSGQVSENQDDNDNEEEDEQEDLCDDDGQQIIDQLQQQQEQQENKKISFKSNKKQRKNIKIANKQKVKPLQKQNKEQGKPVKRRKGRNELQLESDSDQSSSEQNQNPHGFLHVNQIGFYKKSKTQIKADKKANPESKQKFKHKPKQKKAGGTTNKQKKRLKPLMMVRAKKNRIRIQQKQVKLTIKNLKNKLGKVRSGKQAKQLKNKKIVKTQKR